MIVDIITKRYETNNRFPNTNWYNDDRLVIDETKEENKELVSKIMANVPYVELIIEDGEIVDIIPTERPEPEPVILNEPVDEEKAFLSEAVIQLSNELENLKKEIQTLKGGN